MTAPLDTPEFSSLAELDEWLDRGHSLAGSTLAGLDLTRPDIESRVLKSSLRGSMFFGCTLSSELAQAIRLQGGMVFPRFEALPFDPYRSELYTVAELMQGYERGQPETIAETLDARIFGYFKSRHAFGMRPTVVETLACRLHDHAIDRALDDLLRPPGQAELRVVGIMGGHKLRRDDPGFFKVAAISQTLTESGYFIATGGGPGAMEAGNLGSWFAGEPRSRLKQAVEFLKPDPWYLDSHYVDRAFDVLDIHAAGRPSLAVPTWFYGHEPSNLFSTSIAKYFANSIREDGLLAIATSGVIFSPGSAGTIQEIFQDAAQNHYASLGVISPMVFLGEDYWSQFRPVFPLLERMSEGKPYSDMISITDDAESAVQFILEHPPREGW
jgi:predicted Rossmann-fold nucleotide-binding protein